MKKTKLIILLGVCIFLLLYFLFCYHLVNNVFENKTHMALENYVQINYPSSNWEYVKALPYDKNSFLVEIKIKNNKEILKTKIRYYYNNFFDV